MIAAHSGIHSSVKCQQLEFAAAGAGQRCHLNFLMSKAGGFFAHSTRASATTTKIQRHLLFLCTGVSEARESCQEGTGEREEERTVPHIVLASNTSGVKQI